MRKVERVLSLQAQYHQIPSLPLDNIPLRFHSDLQLLQHLSNQTLVRIEEADLVMFRRAYAALILKERGKP